MRNRTIDEVFGNPPGTFRRLIQNQHDRAKLIELNRRNRITALRQGKTPPELHFTVTLAELS